MFGRERAGDPRKGDTGHRLAKSVAKPARRALDPTLRRDYRSALVYVMRKSTRATYFTTADLLYELNDRGLPIYREAVDSVFADAVRRGYIRRSGRDAFRSNLPIQGLMF